MATPTTSWRDLIKVHPAADLFPMMSDAELAKLGMDIVQSGLRHPIVLWPSPDGGMPLLDGRNRLEAIARSGMAGATTWIKSLLGLPLDENETPPFNARAPEIVPEGTDPYSYVVSANIQRRHLNAAQKRELIAALLKAGPAKSDRQIADETKTSPTTVGKVRARVQPGHVDRVDTKGRKVGEKRRDVFKIAADLQEKYGARLKNGPREHQWWHVSGLLDATPANVEQVQTQYYAMGWIEDELLLPYREIKEREGKKLKEAQKFFSTKKEWDSWIKNEIKTCEVSTAEANRALAAAAKAQPADDYIFSLSHDKRVDVLMGIINRRLTPEAKSELHARLEKLILDEPSEPTAPATTVAEPETHTVAPQHAEAAE